MPTWTTDCAEQASSVSNRREVQDQVQITSDILYKQAGHMPEQPIQLKGNSHQILLFEGSRPGIEAPIEILLPKH